MSVPASVAQLEDAYSLKAKYWTSMGCRDSMRRVVWVGPYNRTPELVSHSIIFRYVV